jgi:hypothetical protein
LDTDYSVDFFPILKDKQRRNALDTKTSGGLLICVDVEFAHTNLSAKFFGELFNNGSDHPARATPGGPKINQNGQRRSFDLGCKVLVGDYQGRRVSGKR